MTYMKKIILLVALMTTMVLGMNAQQRPSKVQAYPGIIEKVQPNGDTIRIYLRGDERMHWTMTEDGWQIKENKKGWFKYAKLNRKGEVVSSNKKVHNADKRSKCEIKWLEKNGIKKDL